MYRRKMSDIIKVTGESLRLGSAKCCKVWYVCRYCSRSYAEPEKLQTHKLHAHFPKFVGKALPAQFPSTLKKPVEDVNRTETGIKEASTTISPVPPQDHLQEGERDVEEQKQKNGEGQQQEEAENTSVTEADEEKELPPIPIQIQVQGIVEAPSHQSETAATESDRESNVGREESEEKWRVVSTRTLPSAGHQQQENEEESRERSDTELTTESQLEVRPPSPVADSNFCSNLSRRNRLKPSRVTRKLLDGGIQTQSQGAALSIIRKYRGHLSPWKHKYITVRMRRSNGNSIGKALSTTFKVPTDEESEHPKIKDSLTSHDSGPNSSSHRSRQVKGKKGAQGKTGKTIRTRTIRSGQKTRRRYNKTEYVCQFCGKIIGFRTYLRIHERTHTQEKPFKCKWPQCTYASAMGSNLYSHQRRHGHSIVGGNEKRSRRGIKIGQLNTNPHRKSGADADQQLVRTKKTRKTIQTKKVPRKTVQLKCRRGGRQRYSRTAKSAPCFCKFCDKGFKQNSHFVDHEKVHTGVRPFCCEWPTCSKAFKSKGGLKSHMRRHTGEKPIKCSYCSNRFKYKYQLIRHVNDEHDLELFYLNL